MTDFPLQNDQDFVHRCRTSLVWLRYKYMAQENWNDIHYEIFNSIFLHLFKIITSFSNKRGCLHKLFTFYPGFCQHISERFASPIWGILRGVNPSKFYRDNRTITLGHSLCSSNSNQVGPRNCQHGAKVISSCTQIDEPVQHHTVYALQS